LCFLPKNYDAHVKEDVMGGACSMHAEMVKLQSANSKEKTAGEMVGVRRDENMTLDVKDYRA
jgi:hypothetical protein